MSRKRRLDGARMGCESSIPRLVVNCDVPVGYSPRQADELSVARFGHIARGVSDRRAQALIPLPPIRARRCAFVHVCAICPRSRTVFGSGGASGRAAFASHR